VGWHIHYERDAGRIGVRLVCNQVHAVVAACKLIYEGHRVIRVFSHDGAQCISGPELAQMIVTESVQAPSFARSNGTALARTSGS
jgi:hypothetical protein